MSYNWSNSSANSTTGEHYWSASFDKILLATSMALISVVGIIGNSLVIFIVLKNRKMRSVTNLYIVSLAWTDIMFLVFCGITTTTVPVTKDWIFGQFMCPFVSYMQFVTIQATCGTLTALTVDRYRVITSPLKSMAKRTFKKTMLLIAFIWIGSACLHIPIPIFVKEKTENGYRYCYREFPDMLSDRIYQIYAFISTYLLPLLIIGLCSGLILRVLWSQHENSRVLNKNKDEERVRKQKWRVTKMVFTVAGVFACSWAPIHIMNMWFLLDPHYPLTSIPLFYFRNFCLCLSYANSAMNPFVYALSGRNYRRHLRRMFRKNKHRGLRGSITATTYTSTMTTSVRLPGENGKGGYERCDKFESLDTLT
ncbi:G-protein coupled receptor 54-like [Ptychodera flava]|uniref:G-protein coupled receptor 54-like n=1 Tax=Ptychodera flava TaxID=63121 RepID=UPI00396A49BD